MFIEISFFTHQLLLALEDINIKRVTVYERAGVTESMLTGGLNEKTLLEAHQRLMREALELSGDPAIFLKAGRYLTDFRELGMMGLMMASCPSPLAALLRAQEMIETQVGRRVAPIETLIDPGKEMVTISFKRQAPATTELNWQIETVIASLLNILASITGQAINPISVSLDHPPSATIRDYEDALKVPVKFSQDKIEICFSENIQETPCLFSNREVNLASWNCLLAETNMQVNEQLKPAITRIIWRLILERKRPSLPEIAKAMKLSVRTIQNRLRKEETSFAELLATVRFPEAKRMLAASELSVESIAQRLGYSQLSSFHNAFRDWQGETPGNFRKNAKLAS